MIPDKNKILDILGSPQGRSQLITWNQSTSDIINELIQNHNRIYPDAVKIAPLFKGYSVEDTCHTIYDFLKRYVANKQETGEDQTSKTIAKLLKDGYGDCKHYSNTSASIASALGYDFNYRFADYGYVDEFGKPAGLQHVYTVVKDNGREIIIDGVLDEFNKEKPFKNKLDHKMALRHLSGTEEYIGAGKLKQAAQKVTAAVKTNVTNAKAAVKTNVTNAKAAVKTNVTNAKQAVKTNVVNLQHASQVNKANLFKPVQKVIQKVEHAKHVNRENLKHAVAVNKTNLKKAVKTNVANAKKVIKKVGLAEPRGAFLLLVEANARSLATNLKDTDLGELKSTWEKLGGNFSKLQNAIASGSKRKRLGRIGDPVTASTVLAIITVALPILLVMVKLIKKHAKTPEQQANLQDLENAVSDANSAFTNKTGVDLNSDVEYDTQPGGNENIDKSSLPGGVPKTDDKKGENSSLLPLAAAAAAGFLIFG